MDQPIYDYVVDRLQSAAQTYQEIADGSGVSRRTIEKIARKEIVDPGVSHVQKLADYFHAQEAAA